MALMKGAMTTRRYRVHGALPEGWRERFRDRLNAMAFREPPTSTGKEEIEGWVQVHNLLDTSFDDFNQWLYNSFAVFSLRVDKKSLPGKLLRATVDKKCREWAEERGLEKVPTAKKREIKEALEAEWLSRMLPRVALTEVVWNLDEGYVLIDSLSDSVGDRFRKRFHRTFGLELQPFSPLDHFDDDTVRDALLATSPAVFGGEA
jgi:recombination associated protein RdgC